MLLASAPASGGGGGFTVPTVPTPTSGSTALISPNWTAGFTGKDPYRPVVTAVLEGREYFANGIDQPWYSDGASNAYDMGSVVPTGPGVSDDIQAISEDTSGSTFAQDVVLDYRYVFRTDWGKETAPLSVQHTVADASGADIDHSWTNPGGEWTYVTIYRASQGTGRYYLVADTAVATEAYTDDTADATLILQRDYVRRFRTTKPPKFKGIVAYKGRLFGWTGKDSNLYYGQPYSVAGEAVLDDFPLSNTPVQVGVADGDVITAVVVKYGVMTVFKRKAVYQVEGTDPPFVVNPLFSQRGALAEHSVTEVDGWTYFLDEEGLYFTDLRGEPYTAGAGQTGRLSPMAPVWDRLNLDAKDFFRLQYIEETGLLLVHVALDFDPTPDDCIVYDTAAMRFISEDTGIPAFAAGMIEDGQGRQYHVVADELLNVFQLDVGNSDGTFLGSTTANITAVGDRQQITCSAATFDETEGSSGSTIDIYSAAGDVTATSRVYNVTSGTTLLPLRFQETAPAVGGSLGLGVIPWTWRMIRSAYGTPMFKRVTQLLIECDVQASGTLLIESATDSGSFRRHREVDMTTGRGNYTVRVDDRFYRHQIRGVMRYAGMDADIHAISFDVGTLAGQIE